MKPGPAMSTDAIEADWGSRATMRSAISRGLRLAIRARARASGLAKSPWSSPRLRSTGMSGNGSSASSPSSRSAASACSRSERICSFTDWMLCGSTARLCGRLRVCPGTGDSGPPSVRCEGSAFYMSGWNCRSFSVTVGTVRVRRQGNTEHGVQPRRPGAASRLGRCRPTRRTEHGVPDHACPAPGRCQRGGRMRVPSGSNAAARAARRAPRRRRCAPRRAGSSRARSTPRRRSSPRPARPAAPSGRAPRAPRTRRRASPPPRAARCRASQARVALDRRGADVEPVLLVVEPQRDQVAFDATALVQHEGIDGPPPGT